MNVSKILLLLSFVLASQFSFAQLAKEKIAASACECLNKQKKAGNADFEAMVNDCFESAIFSNMDLLAEEYGEDNLSAEFGQEFGEELGALLVQDCPVFMELAMQSEGIMTEAAEPSKFDDMKSPTAAKVAKKSCKCIGKLDEKTAEAIQECVEPWLTKFEKKFIKENDKEELSETDEIVIINQILENLDANCASFDISDMASPAGDSEALAMGMANDACDCFKKIDPNLSGQALDVASEKCFEIATEKNADLMAQIYGEEVLKDNFADLLMEDIGPTLMTELISNCPVFMEIIQKTEE